MRTDCRRYVWLALAFVLLTGTVFLSACSRKEPAKETTAEQADLTRETNQEITTTVRLTWEQTEEEATCYGMPQLDLEFLSGTESAIQKSVEGDSKAGTITIRVLDPGVDFIVGITPDYGNLSSAFIAGANVTLTVESASGTQRFSARDIASRDEGLGKLSVRAYTGVFVWYPVRYNKGVIEEVPYEATDVYEGWESIGGEIPG